jgi:membrane protease YdiL (CAAX protease family)
VLWCVGATVAQWVGIWRGIGASALVLGAVTLLWDGPGQRSRLAPRLRALGIGVLGGVVMVLATYGIYPWAARLFPFIGREATHLYGQLGTVTAVGWLLLTLIVLAEELVWRALVQSALVARLGTAGGVVLAAALYGLAHLPAGSPMLALVALGCGLIWGALAAWTGSVAASFVMHLLWDIAVLSHPLIAW